MVLYTPVYISIFKSGTAVAIKEREISKWGQASNLEEEEMKLLLKQCLFQEI